MSKVTDKTADVVQNPIGISNLLGALITAIVGLTTAIEQDSGVIGAVTVVVSAAWALYGAVIRKVQRD